VNFTRTAVLVVVVLLLSTAPVFAECAWVLWVRQSVIDPNSTIGAPRLYADEYVLNSAHATKEDCVTAGRAYIIRTNQAETLKSLGLEDPNPRTIGLI
jgi:hypothetical protein